MSFYLAIIGTKDNPLFEHEFGTSKQGGDGIARFREEARRVNGLIVHSSLDIVEEVQWGNGNMYLKIVDRYNNSYISAFITGTNIKFLLLSTPDTILTPTGGFGGPAQSTASLRPAAARTNAAFTSFNPTSPAVEEGIKNFFQDLYELWLKAIMNPFRDLNMPLDSPEFRRRVAGSARKFL